MLSLELLQSVDEAVVLRVADRRRGKDVIPPIVLANLPAKSLDLGRGIHVAAPGDSGRAHSAAIVAGKLR